MRGILKRLADRRAARSALQKKAARLRRV